VGSIIIASLSLPNLSSFLLQLGQLQDGAEEDTHSKAALGGRWAELALAEQPQPQHGPSHHRTPAAGPFNFSGSIFMSWEGIF